MNGDKRNGPGRSRLGCPQSPLSSGRNIGDLHRSPEVERLLQISEIHLAADDTQGALDALARAEQSVMSNGRDPRELAELLILRSDCLQRRGELDAALECIKRTMALLPNDGDQSLRGRALFRAGKLNLRLGDYHQALHLCQASYDILRVSDEHVENGLLELTLGAIHMRSGRVQESKEFFESALFSFRRMKHREGVARALNNLGSLLKNGPRWRDALDYLQRALAVSEDIGNSPHIATHCTNLGILLTKLCEWNEAETLLARSISIHKELSNTFHLACTLLAMGNLQRRRGKFDAAAEVYAEARAICEEHGYARELVLCWETTGDLQADQGKLEDARRSLQEALKMALEVAPGGDLVPEIQRRLAQLELQNGQLSAARELALASVRGARRVGDAVEGGAAMRVLGEVRSQRGQKRGAERVLRRSLAMLSRTPDRLELSLTQAALGRHLAGRQETVGNRICREALHSLQAAGEFFVSADLPASAASVLIDTAAARAACGDYDLALRDLARASHFAEQVARPDLHEKLNLVRRSLERGTAQAAVLSSPEMEVVREWSTSISTGAAPRGNLENMLQFAVGRLNSLRAFLALPNDGCLKVAAVVCMEVAAARKILPLVEKHRQRTGVVLSTEISQDPRFHEEKESIFSGVTSFAAITLRLPRGDGLLYVDRDTAFGQADLRVLSALAGLLSVGLIHNHAAGAPKPAITPPQGERSGPLADYITVDPEILQSFQHLERVGKSAVSILLLGETGTGKGLLAQCIHRLSGRRTQTFVPVNCAAIPENLLESELFGHVSGAFTGARREKPGLFEEAAGGTIFLDEISRTSLGVQAKLLHAIDTHEIRRVGATQSKRIDVRVVCASHADLWTAIRNGVFLEDLFYRLSDFTVFLPPLRERTGDVELLLDHFFERVCREMKRRPHPIEGEVRERLLTHEWRGNIRELIQVVRRLIALGSDGERLTLDLLPPEIRDDQAPGPGTEPEPLLAGGSLREQVTLLERRLISDALAHTGWNRSAAARRLSISYPNLLAKIKLFGLKP